MKAFVYHREESAGWEEVPRPTLLAGSDAIVSIDVTTICGTDLHILKGDLPAVADGRVIGHEAVGTVVEVGASVQSLAIGDRVLVSCVTACGACRFCRAQRPGQCTGGGGWILGNEIDGTQAEFARIPFADNSTYRVPAGVADEDLLMLSDILPTAYEVGVLNGDIRPADAVAVVGAGPVGLSAILGAKLLSPSLIIAIDKSPGRLDAAKRFGADVVINNDMEDAVEAVLKLTDGLGADVAIEAVGVAATFELATELVRPCGRVANIGVHGAPATLHLERLWDRDVTITTGLVDATSTPSLLRLLVAGQIDPRPFITHRFKLHDIAEAYDVFSRAADTGALKVVMHGEMAKSNP